MQSAYKEKEELGGDMGRYKKIREDRRRYKEMRGDRCEEIRTNVLDTRCCPGHLIDTGMRR